MPKKTAVKDDRSKNVPGAFRIFKDSVRLVVRQWRVFGGIVLVYVTLHIIFSQIISGKDIAAFKDAASGTGGILGGLWSSLSTLEYVSSTSGSSTATSGAYQLFATVIVSLAIIWALRQTYAGQRFKVRDAFYKGMYPLVPFVLVLLVVMLQILPALLGLFIYNLVSVSTGAAGVELALWGVIAIFGTTITVFLLAVSLPALYIVCLTDMTPLAALRSSKDLVRGRRWLVARRIVLLPVLMFMAIAVFMLTVIYLAPALGGIAFLFANAVTLLLFHSYLYGLYRELL